VPTPPPTAASNRLSVSAEVIARFPQFRLAVVYAYGVRNGPSDEASRQWIREGLAAGMARLGNCRISDHPAIKAWRAVYSAFGAKPSAYPCSAESLLQRALKGGADAIPGINRLVDAYNAVSLSQLLPIGGEDLDRMVGQGVLRFATAADAEADEASVSDRPKPGEVIWADDLGWTCRRWNWRQGARTRLTESTRNAYFIVEGLCSEGAEPDLDAAVLKLQELIEVAGTPQRLQVARLA
jgi:DNA/RNA-binding domain of Phe-tRNA-synthetase-like protein